MGKSSPHSSPLTRPSGTLFPQGEREQIRNLFRDYSLVYDVCGSRTRVNSG
jgi:hypothetical protein